MRRMLALGLLLSACDAPKDTLVQRCIGEMFSQGGRCEVTAGKLARNQTAYLDANTKNMKVRVDASFTVAKGKVTVVFPGCEQGGRADVTPEQPATLECDASVNRRNFTFSLETYTTGAEGFSSVVNYKPL